MGTVGRPKLARPRKPRTAITQELKEKIVRDHHDNHYSFTDLSAKYGCCFKVCKDICQQNAYGFWNKPDALAKKRKEHAVTADRVKLSKTERDTKISDDALEIIELALQRMKKILRDESETVSATQLKDFVNSVIPYVKAKADAGKKDEGKTKDKSDKFDMWNKIENSK